jgi:hypothetical protein
MTNETGPRQAAVLSYSGTDRLFVLVGLPALFALIGFGVQLAAPWVLDTFRVVPFGFVFRLVASLDTPPEIALYLLVWTAAGCAVAGLSFWGEAKATVTAGSLTVTREGRAATFAREDVSAVFLDGKDLVVLDRRSREVAREPPRATEQALAAALKQFRFPWRDGDPYARIYRPWTPGTGDLPEAANAMLALRAAALRRKAGTEARGLRAAVQELGFVVRDDASGQSWRPLVSS